ncbi:MAG: Zn-dependent exopeptidase M28 [Bacteroidales bacterium]|nr:Zn-dependent exopeptidase M28 [Bacteroidales bacterium]MCF8457566.1 Zn-dependent exopeptidase M28 [Bacteroidales bacterium]
MKNFLITITILFLSITAFSQDIQYVRRIIEKLASPDFHGRGYVENGDGVAAKYISEEIELIGLQQFNGSWFQKFTMPVNTFPSHMQMAINGKELKPGIDYLVHASSNSIRGNYHIAWINKKVVEYKDALNNMLSNDLSDYFIAIDTTGIDNPIIKEFVKYIIDENPAQARGIIEVVPGNLTSRPSLVKKDFPFIQIVKGILEPENEEMIKLRVKSKFKRKYKTQNVMAFIPGEVDSFMVFTAHYDHIGRMGAATYFPGANDNASGSAMILDLARYYKNKAEKPHYSIAFIWFAAEEAGLLGSKFYTEHPIFPLSKIKQLWNLDLMGSGEDGIKVVNGSVFTREFDLLKSINAEKNYLKKVASRGAAANSDHYFFSEKGVHSFFIYTMGTYKEYHNIYDKADGLPLNEYEDIFRLLVDFMNHEGLYN